MSDNKIIVGIDLGTTTSEACVYSNNKYQHIKSGQGNQVVPSVVGWDKDGQQFVAGEMAHNRAKASPADYVYFVKRYMGTDKIFKLGDKEMSAPEVSAEMLKYIKKYCEEHYDEEILHAVVTVPANFNNNQRQDTKRAAELAGFTVERIIAEPTAAALAYCMENSKEDDFVKVMVYDLGGGTFDVTIGEFHKGVLDIKGTSGDNKLGGKDFDELLSEVFFDKLVEQHGVDLRNDDLAYHSVMRECENLKKDLSYQNTSSINIPFLAAKDGKPIGLSENYNRAEFDQLISPLIERTSVAITSALKSAKYQTDEIDLILLVGGSTRIPLVKNTVEQIMKKKPKTDIDPDLAVSLGAAMQAAIIGGESDGVIMDVVPHSFGTSAAQEYNGQIIPGFYSEIIEANSPMLKSYTQSYFTITDNQDEVDFEVFQKPALVDSIWANDMDYLGEQKIDGIPNNLAGKEAIDASFTYNLNGIIEVSILIKSTGKSHSFEIDSTNSQKSMPTALPQGPIPEKKINWEDSDLADQFSSTIELVRRKLEKVENSALENKLDALLKAISENEKSNAEELDDELNDILFEMDE